MSLPKIAFEPRVHRDVRCLLAFIGRQPLGKPEDREAELEAAYERIRRTPFARPVYRWVSNAQIGLGDSQRSIRKGKVSIRAVRHYRERNVFFGVKEVGTLAAPAPELTPHHT